MTLAAYVYAICVAAIPQYGIPANHNNGMGDYSACKDYATRRYNSSVAWGIDPAIEVPNGNSGGVAIGRGRR